MQYILMNLHMLMKARSAKFIFYMLVNYGGEWLLEKRLAMSHIKEFYSGANVLLTGATGLVGKLLISKILIEVQDVGGFYLVIREKRSKSSTERLDEIFDDPVS